MVNDDQLALLNCDRCAEEACYKLAIVNVKSAQFRALLTKVEKCKVVTVKL